MLSPREHQSWWSRLKTPAAVSLACLAATLLIAAQGFRSHPSQGIPASTAAAQSDTAASHAQSTTASSSGGRGAEKAETVFPETLQALPRGEAKSKSSGGAIRTEVDHPTGTMDLPTGPHKEKGFDLVEIVTMGDPAAGSGSGVASGSGATSRRSNATQEAANSQGEIMATLEEVHGAEVLIVNKTLNGRAPNGVLLVFHGCSHSARDWWYSNPNCLNCTGLPEEVAVTKAALKRDFVVVAFSSTDRSVHQCWDVSFTAEPQSSVDMLKVTKAWGELVAREGWGRVPHYALGGSSGGAFVLFLAQSVPLDGVIPIIAAVPPEALEARPRAADSSKSWPFPPTFFVHMQRDEALAQGVAADLVALKKQGIVVNEIAVPPTNLSATFFSDRIEQIDNTTSAALYAALLSEGCLNSTGYLVDNPRSLSMMRRWQKAVRDNVPAAKAMNLNKDESPIFEELNVAWAAHELVSDHTDAVLDWLAARRDGPKLMTAVNPRL